MTSVADGNLRSAIPLDQSGDVAHKVQNKIKKLHPSLNASKRMDSQTRHKYHSTDRAHNESTDADDDGIRLLLEETSKITVDSNVKEYQDSVRSSSRARKVHTNKLPPVPPSLSTDCFDDVPIPLTAAVSNNYIYGREFPSSDRESNFSNTLFSTATKTPPLISLSSSRNSSRDNLCLWGQTMTSLSSESFSIDSLPPSAFESPSQSMMHTFSTGSFSPSSTFSSFSRNSSFTRSAPLSPHKHVSRTSFETGQRSIAHLPHISPMKNKKAPTFTKGNDTNKVPNPNPNPSTRRRSMISLSAPNSLTSSQSVESDLNKKEESDIQHQRRKEKNKDKKRKNVGISQLLAQTKISVMSKGEDVPCNMQILYCTSDEEYVTIIATTEKMWNHRLIVNLLENDEVPSTGEEIKIKSDTKGVGKKDKKKDKLKNKDRNVLLLSNSVERKILLEDIRRMIPIGNLDIDLLGFQNMISDYFMEENIVTIVSENVDLDSVQVLDPKVAAIATALSEKFYSTVGKNGFGESLKLIILR